MPQLDQYESQFKSAAKVTFQYEPIQLGKVLVVTDLAEEDAAKLRAEVERFLASAPCCAGATWSHLAGDAYDSTQALFARVQEASPDLVVTYRNLKERENPVYTLGTYLDVLTQVAPVPVLVVPDLREHALEVQGTQEVLVVTDHLTGDHRLVNYGVRFTRPGGSLFLSHVEDDHTFQRYLGIISRLPSLDTDAARQDIPHQLLKEPTDYIASCKLELEQHAVDVGIRPIVKLGHRVRDYRRLVQEHEVDLLVFNTKDEDQLAMNGLAYSLALEIKHIPLLLL